MKISRFTIDLWIGMNIVWIVALVISNLWYGIEPRWNSSVLWNIFFTINWIALGTSIAILNAAEEDFSKEDKP